MFLIISAILSLILVAVIYQSHRNQSTPVLNALVALFVSVMLSVFCIMMPLVIHAILVVVGTLIWSLGGWRSSYLLAYMSTVGVVLYGIFGCFTIHQVIEFDRLREEYPFVSMESRVPAPKPIEGKRAVGGFTLGGLEEALHDKRDWERTRMLARLHSDKVEHFIDTPGFGIARFRPPNVNSLTARLDHDGSAIAQPALPPLSTMSESDLQEAQNVEKGPLEKMHLASVLDFVNPRGFGYIISRQKVAGFQPHQFAALPQTAPWKIQSIELVSLLMHEEARVYVSDELPRMDKLRQAPTRTLNTFEATGLQKLQEGEHLFVRGTPHGIRMLGAVRSIDECIKCHGGERGDLLGAFSYSIAAAPGP